MSIEEVGCCGAYCGTCPEFKKSLCKGCKTGYADGTRDLSRARCRIKICCIKNRLNSCADCEEYDSCTVIQDFFAKNERKYKKYKQALDFIRTHGYQKFLNITDGWTQPSGKYD